MSVITFSVDFQAAGQALQVVRDRAANPGRGLAGAPALLRSGAGGFAEQIAARSGEDLAGAHHPWQEPAFTRGAFPPAAQRREQVLWDAALGGAGSITRIDERSVTIGVDDLAVRQLSAAIGNGLVSEDSYFGDVTGRFGTRLTPITVFPSKPLVRGVRASSSRRRRQAKSEEEDRAARVFIGLTYHTWFTLNRFLQGISLPPKPIMVSARSYAAVRDALAAYLLGRPVYAGASVSIQRAA